MTRLNASLTSGISRFDAPDQALRRLNLDGVAGRGFLGVVNASGSDLARAVVQIDGERQRLELGFGRADEAVGVLRDVEEKLAELKSLVAANTRGGAGPMQKNANQKQIDSLLEAIDEALADTGKSLGSRVFAGDTRLVAGERSLDVPEVTLERLGRHSSGGRTVNLGELKSRRLLDTVRRQGPARAGAKRAVEMAVKEVGELRESLETFTKETLRPRVADVAEVMGAIYTSLSEINTSSEAQAVLREVRELTLKSSAVATAIGADGWDRNRVLDLLT